jgi:hypothetical protein|tara:strand:- start:1408 stop:1656 length:249 start_codon:yes stop_codon:yes gene_type:complete
MAEKTDYKYLDEKVFKMAAMLDTMIRFHSDNMDLDDMEQNYVDIWLQKERDPLLVTILATITGARNPDQEGADEEDTTAEAA